MTFTFGPTVNPGRHRRVKQRITERVDEMTKVFKAHQTQANYEITINAVMDRVLAERLDLPVPDDQFAKMEADPSILEMVDATLWHLKRDWKGESLMSHLEAMTFVHRWQWLNERWYLVDYMKEHGHAYLWDKEGRFHPTAMLFDEDILVEYKRFPDHWLLTPRKESAPSHDASVESEQADPKVMTDLYAEMFQASETPKKKHSLKRIFSALFPGR